MTSARHLQWKTYALLVPIVFFSSTGNVLLGKGMKQIGEVRDWRLASLGALFVKASMNGWVWLGIGSLLLFLVSFMVVLSWADYSFVMPASAVSYAVATLMSHWALGELVTPQRGLGVGVICLGVALVTRTPSSSRGWK
jgi:drug/metabolite transporter (DMT)-like permease